MQLLTAYAGSWTGTNGFRLMPDDPPAEADATAQLSLGAVGNVTALAYTWRHPDDGPQEGLIMLGSDEEPGAVLALWGDSWHQKPAARQLRGTVEGDGITVGGEYAEGWEWWITVTASEPDVLRLRMDNVVPAAAHGTAEATRYWAMDAELRRPR